ncbi:MAG: outer membrane protein transport protein [Deltaproteobacteria bacterium]|nr:outer membrane protein transport protein [Deltaproteobacteria bacterium]
MFMKRIAFLFIFVLLSFVSLQVKAGGLDLDLLYGSRYVSMGGNHVTIVDDAYGPFYNPATMAYVKRPSLAFNSSTLMFGYEAPIGADNQQRKTDINYGPLFYMGAVYPWTDRISFGFAVYPTALQGGKYKNINYGPNFLGKEYGNQLVRIEIAPAVSVKLHDHFSLGATYKVAYTRYDKTIGVFADATYSAVLDSSVSTWDAQGLKVGALVNDIGGLSFGVTYRPQLDLELSGNTNILSAASPTGVDARTTQKISIPAQLQVGASYEWIKDRFLSVVTYEYTENSVIKEDAPVIDTNIFTAEQTKGPLNYKDGHTIHVGSEYTFQLANQRKLRTGAGVVWDKTVTSKTTPNPALAPSADYYGAALGGQYDIGKHIFGMALNYGQYSHVSTDIETPALDLKVFKGKYALRVFFAVLDYQFKF